MDKEQVDHIFTIFSKANPYPKTELKYTNNFTLLVAVVLSAQATDISVNKATKELFIVASTPQDMINLGEEGLKYYIKSIGLFNSKAKSILKLSSLLVEKYHSIVPDNMKDLESLPGVGRKTANVVMNCAFGMPTIAVDTHVFRTSRRIGFSHSTTPEKVEQDLLKIISKKWLTHAHHWLILHGRYICKAKKPLCEQCLINEYCEFYKTCSVNSLISSKL
jgi:endonuclease-3